MDIVHLFFVCFDSELSADFQFEVYVCLGFRENDKTYVTNTNDIQNNYIKYIQQLLYHTKHLTNNPETYKGQIRKRC